MKPTWQPVLLVLAVWLSLFAVSVSSDEQGSPATASPSAGEKKTPETESNDSTDPALEVARQRAKVMHDVYAATLDVLHHRYFHRDKAIIPARVMEDIFDELQQQSKTQARWIAASLSAMGVDHEPKTEFEKKAARQIADGVAQVEIVEDGFYRRAGAIRLHSDCVSCHGGFFKQSTKPQFAGLIISVPLRNTPPEESK